MKKLATMMKIMLKLSKVKVTTNWLKPEEGTSLILFRPASSRDSITWKLSTPMLEGA